MGIQWIDGALVGAGSSDPYKVQQQGWV